MNILGVAIIGPSKSLNGFGNGQYVLDEIIQNQRTKLIALGGRSKKRLVKSLVSAGCKDDNVLLFDLKNIEYLFKLNNVDLIIIATPIKTHLKYLKLAVVNKKNVLIEKPLVNFSNLDKKVNQIFEIACKQNTLISTLCQRTLVVDKIRIPPKINSIFIKMVFGKKDRVLNKKEFFIETISHPISILVKLGFDKINEYDFIRIIEKPIIDENHLEIKFVYKGVDGTIILIQKEKKELSSTEIQINNDASMYVNSKIIKNKFYTSYDNGLEEIIDEEQIVKTIRLMIDALFSNNKNPLINNMESVLIHNIEKRFYNNFKNNHYE